MTVLSALWALWRRSPAAPATHAAPQDDVRAAVLLDAIEPALATLEKHGIPSDARARRMLLAIAGQESACIHRRQHNNGPATGLWQFERGGGVIGVLTHRATFQTAARFCVSRGVQPIKDEVWKALERDDVLAAGFARLLLWSDPKPLPVDQDEGWNYYLRNWRPGKPHPDRWPDNWRRAEAALFG